MRIALDAMGGDHGPTPNVQGAIAALQELSDLEVVLVGDVPVVEKQLSEAGFSDSRLTLEQSEGFVEMHEKPTEALRKKPNSSIAVCWKLMAARSVDALVSAGHTGAVVASGLRTRLFLKGVKRPGIAVTLPTLKGRSLLLDVGANPAARPEHLYQYGVMGLIYAEKILGIANPRVGLMNIGSEEGKGNELYKETHNLLSRSRLRDRYVGNVEGRGLYQGQADVLICEGFVGNVVLKVSEGMADFLFKAITPQIVECLDTERELAVNAFRDVGRQYQYSEQGGAPLLGIDGACVICHGSSDARAIQNAIKSSAKLINRDINGQFTSELSEEMVADAG
ncbi:MAG: phosphate acyltransferase PlsX [Planctomycetota bacterium]|nr:phosphate acyltransferase PlsX [Planctomycetota bacterium]MDA1165768.1 phosphate acyltransferase PlsX [Planctomycetota bacterium]